MSLEGRQQTNKGYLEAQAFANDPDNNTAPSPSFLEREIGVNAYGLAQVGSLLTDVGANLPTADQKAALDAASSPSALNAIATIDDLSAFSAPTSFFYDFNATAGVPASGEIRMDNADADLATVLRLHNLNRNGANVGNILLKASSNDAIIIQDNLEGDKVYNFDVTGTPTQVGGTGASGYIEVPVSLFSQGSTEITSSDVVVAAVYQDGNNSAFLQVNSNLSDVQNAATARSNIGAGIGDMVGSNNLSEITNAATARSNIGAGTGNGDMVGSNNLSDVSNAATARSNIGAGTGNGDMVGSNNLSEITNAATARSNIGAGTGNGDMVGSNNLSDVSSAATSRTNLDVYSTTEVDDAISSSRFMCYLSDTAGSASTTYTSPLLGTRISTSDAQYASSTFDLTFKARLGAWVSADTKTGSYIYDIEGFIKKNASGEPFLHIDIITATVGAVHNADASQIVGTVSTDGSTVAMDADSLGYGGVTAVDIERVDDGVNDELCFRLNWTGRNETYHFHGIITGPVSYTGTAVTSSNGTTV